MVVDVDDHYPENDAMPWMLKLKEINPAFKVTLFAVPGRGSDEFWKSHPDWVELAVHGWRHETVDECIEWDYQRSMDMLLTRPERFVRGFKAPGWQISQPTYDVLVDYDWWVADQHLEDARRPEELRTYFYEDGSDRVHLHVQDVCGNGLNESWDWLVERVASATEFKWCSESLT
jgi:hypothetical protein